MRIDLQPIIEQAQTLLTAIEAKSKSRASSAAHKLLCTLPDPTWAETAPGMKIMYGIESDVSSLLEMLRMAAMTWLALLIHPDKDLEPTDKWPTPATLEEATCRLAQYMPQNASVS